MLDKILIEACRRVGVAAIVIYSETANSLVDVNNGLADAEMNRIEGMETSYTNLHRVKEPNMIMEFVAFSNDIDIEISDWESIRNYRIGIVKGWKILEMNTVGFPYITLVPTEVELFRMLQKNRLDIALYSKLTGYSFLIENGYIGIKHIDPPLEKKAMYMYIHKSKSYYCIPIADALRSMKEDGTYQRIVDETLLDLYD